MDDATLAAEVRDYFRGLVDLAAAVLVEDGLAADAARDRAHAAVAIVQGGYVLARALDDPDAMAAAARGFVALLAPGPTAPGPTAPDPDATAPEDSGPPPPTTRPPTAPRCASACARSPCSATTCPASTSTPRPESRARSSSTGSGTRSTRACPRRTPRRCRP